MKGREITSVVVTPLNVFALEGDSSPHAFELDNLLTQTNHHHLESLNGAIAASSLLKGDQFYQVMSGYGGTYP